MESLVGAARRAAGKTRFSSMTKQSGALMSSRSDSTERRLKQLAQLDDLLGVFAVYLDIEDINTGEAGRRHKTPRLTDPFRTNRLARMFFG